MHQIIAAANTLAERWAATCSGPSTVMAGPGAWPLLALLASAADGPGRRELETAVGVDASAAADAADELLAILDQAPAVRAALGLWTHQNVMLNPSWRPPVTTRGTLTGDPVEDQRSIDSWAAKETGGLIPSVPMNMDPDLLLASALTVRTQWSDPCEGKDELFRDTGDLGAASVVAAPGGPVTMVRVVGEDDIDVLLVRGDGRPGQVLGAAFGALDDRFPVTGGADLPEGSPAPGVTVWFGDSEWPDGQLTLRVPKFKVTGSHDLTKLPDVFGLAAVTSRTHGHFPGISDDPPLAIDQAGQEAVAKFDAHGFEAAAVTYIGAVAISVPLTYQVKNIEVRFERPFGFLAVHRPTGLILTTGWDT